MADADAALRAALAADLERLQFVLLTALDSEHGRGIVEDELTLEEKALVEKREIPQEATFVFPGKSTKRKRFENCEQCARQFDVTANGQNQCVWHSGCLMVNLPEGYWCGAGEDIDTQENRENFPEAFIWSCCSEQSNVEGCMIGFHTACASSQKKSRF